MRRAKIILAAAAAAGLAGQLAYGVDYTWQSFAGGTYSWDQPGVWSPAGFPNANGDSANLSGAVTGGPLNIAVNANYTVSTLTVGSTGNTLLTDIGNANSGGGAIVLENGAGAGTATVLANGIAGATTSFSAPVQLGATIVAIGASTLQSSNFRVDGTSPVNFLGGIRVLADDNAADGTLIQRRVLTLNAGSTTTGNTFTFGNIVLSQAGAVQRGELQVTVGGTTTSFGGTVVFDGVISSGAVSSSAMLYGFGGSATSTPAVLPTYVFNQDNTYGGTSNIGKGNYVLRSATPFGTGQVNVQHAASSYGANFQSDSDTRAIANNIQLQNNLTISGQNSLTLNGNMFQSNNREFTNLLPAGKTVTINGFVAAATSSDGATEFARALLFDGSGETIVNGPIYNHRSPWWPGSANDTLKDGAVDQLNAAIGGLAKRGTGVMTVNSTVLPTITDGTTTFTGPSSTYNGPTTVMGGLLQFASPLAYGKLDSWSGGSLSITNNPGTSRVTVIGGGAVGVLDGTITDDFVGRLNAATLSGGNTGGLALAPADTAKTLDFSTGSLNGSGVVGMSVGAVKNGVTFTGTIIPEASRGYRLGGGGKLTLPNANQLTGGNSVTVTNGGVVAVTGSNNYTGSTTVRGDYIRTNELQSGATRPFTDSFINVPTAIRVDSTLEVSTLANGGASSGIGASSSAAGNLVLNGGTLRYVGGATSSDRLLTVGPVGATLDASGSGVLNLTNTGALSVTDVGPISAATLSTGGNARLIQGLGDISSLTPGMTVTATIGGVGTFLPAGSTIQGIIPNFGFTGGNPAQVFIMNNQIVVSAGAGTSGVNATLTFGNQNRNLTLTGNNAGGNTLAAQLVDSAAGRLGLVKSGAGAWNVTNSANTFTGGVTVNAGTLTVKKLVNNGTTTINGGTLRIGPGGPVADATSTSVFQEGQFSVAGGATPAGRLDLAKNGAVFDYATTSPLATIADLVKAGYNSGNWAGNGITSSDASATPSAHAVGFAEASDIGSPATFLGQAVDGTAVLVRYTRAGDANLSGTTDIGDFSTLAANFNQTGSTWARGDFNFDGVTSIGDFSTLAANFNQAAAGALPRGSVVPEPAALSLLAAGTFLLGRRRTRRGC